MNNRRNFIKSSALGVSSLFAMSKMAGSPLYAKSGATGGTPRFIFLRKSSGISPKWIVPPSINDKPGAMEASLDRHDLPDWMSPLTKHKKHLTLLNGLSARMCSMGHAAFQGPMAVCKAQGGRADSIPRASVDVELGRLFPTPFSHLEFMSNNLKGVVDGLSSFGPRQPNFAFASPRAAYDTLFAVASKDKNVQVKNELEASMYKFLHGNLAETSQRIQRKENFRKYDAYTQSVDSVIKRNEQLYKMRDQIKKHAPTLSGEILDDNYDVKEQHEAFVDLALASMYAGLSNSVTITLDVLYTVVTGVFDKAPIQLHHIGHNKDLGGLSAVKVREILRKHHMSLVDRLVNGLKKMPEGNGTMFDNTIIMYLPENGEAHHSKGTAVPFVILSGDKVKLDIGGGRYIRLAEYQNKEHKTLGNFYTTLLNAYGNSIKHYGDLDVGLKIDQEGPIKQLMKG